MQKLYMLFERIEEKRSRNIEGTELASSEDQQEFINQIHRAILDFDVDFLQNI